MSAYLLYRPVIGMSDIWIQTEHLNEACIDIMTLPMNPPRLAPPQEEKPSEEGAKP